MIDDPAPFRLTTQQRRTLQRLVHGTREALLLRRAQALLWCDDGESTTDIAGRLGVSRQTVHNWITGFTTRSGPVSERLADAARSGRPATAPGVIDPLIAALIDGDPRDWGYAATAWTAPLLQKHLAEHHQKVVSVISVRRAIHRMRRRWKRPRYRLALRSATWRQAKGGYKEAYPAVSARSY
jgi:transposase